MSCSESSKHRSANAKGCGCGFSPTQHAHHCLVLGKRTIPPLVQDEDTPRIRNIGNYLIHMAMSEAYGKLGNAQGAANCKAKADAALEALLDLDVRQTA